MNSKIVLFDGYCNLCNGAVQFLIKRDTKGVLKFSSLQSDFAQKLLQEKGLSTNNFSTFIYLHDGAIYQKSDAALLLLDSFSLPWRLLKVGYLLPKKFRNYLYDLIASNRYKLFGKRDQCMVPSESLREKFL